MELTSLQGEQADPSGHFKPSKTMIQHFHIPLNDPTVTHTIVFTRKDGIWPHEPLRDARGNVLEGFQYRTEQTTLSQDFVKRTIDSGRSFLEKDPNSRSRRRRRFLEVYCAFIIQYNEMSVEMIRRFVKPESIEDSSKFCAPLT